MGSARRAAVSGRGRSVVRVACRIPAGSHRNSGGWPSLVAAVARPQGFSGKQPHSISMAGSGTRSGCAGIDGLRKRQDQRITCRVFRDRRGIAQTEHARNDRTAGVDSRGGARTVRFDHRGCGTGWAGGCSVWSVGGYPHIVA